jgi:hypothetical protein
MADTSLSSRFLKLVEELERLKGEMNIVQKEIYSVTEAMTEEEVEELAKKLPPGEHAIVQALELDLQHRRSPPIE